jgi:hypothetical protein
LRRIHIDDARRNLFPRQNWALQQLEDLEQFFPNPDIKAGAGARRSDMQTKNESGVIPYEKGRN